MARALEVSRRVPGRGGRRNNQSNESTCAYCYMDQRKFAQAEPSWSGPWKSPVAAGERRATRRSFLWAILPDVYIDQGKLAQGEALLIKAWRLPPPPGRPAPQDVPYHEQPGLAVLEPGGSWPRPSRSWSRRWKPADASTGSTPIRSTHRDKLAVLYRLDRKFHHSIPLLEGVLKGTRDKWAPTTRTHSTPWPCWVTATDMPDD